MIENLNKQEEQNALLENDKSKADNNLIKAIDKKSPTGILQTSHDNNLITPKDYN